MNLTKEERQRQGRGRVLEIELHVCGMHAAGVGRRKIERWIRTMVHPKNLLKPVGTSPSTPDDLHD